MNALRTATRLTGTEGRDTAAGTAASMTACSRWWIRTPSSSKQPCQRATLGMIACIICEQPCKSKRHSSSIQQCNMCAGFLCCSYCQHKIRSAKRSARSELSVTRGEWAKHGYAKSDILSTEGIKDEVPRIHVSVSLQQWPVSLRTKRSMLIVYRGLLIIGPLVQHSSSCWSSYSFMSSRCASNWQHMQLC